MKLISPVISVIIVTKNRPKKLGNCLESLISGTFDNFEIIIIDQGKEENSKIITSKLNKFTRLKYIHSSKTGKSRGLNLAIALSSSNLLAFTDDDCILDIDWLKEIVNGFNNFPEVSGMFGQTTYYNKTKQPGTFCPCTFTSKQRYSHLIKKPTKHWEDIGFGNNMAFQKKTLTELGSFKEWLGPGSIGSNAEDAELAQRFLVAKKYLLYNHKMIVSHDKWLGPFEKKLQELSYMCGEVACYGYLSLRGHTFAKNIMKQSLSSSLYEEPKEILKNIFLKKMNFFSGICWWISSLVSKLRGLIVALYYHQQEKSHHH